MSSQSARSEPRSDTVDALGKSKNRDPDKRNVCDHCRRRRVRCDGKNPCQQCRNACLTCKREHVPRKRGPKRGHGRVIDELRAREAVERQCGSRESSAELDWTGSNHDPASTPNSPPDISWQKNASDPRHAPEPRSAWSHDTYRPTSRSYLHLIPRCVDLYYEHIYPIMPLLYMPTIRAMLSRPEMPLSLPNSDRNLLYALCALTCLHMSGKNIPTDGPLAPDSWEVAGRFFLDECISNRASYDFLEDESLHAVISSFWLHTSFFEINQSRKAWLYLREALTLALEMKLDDEASYAGLTSRDQLCRQRVFWILFVTERSFAILRNKTITFKKTPSLPTTRHHYETPDIHAGFLQLVSSYVPLDDSFVTAWNDGSDPRVSALTYLALQDRLSMLPAFLNRSSRATTPSTTGSTPLLSFTAPFAASTTANVSPTSNPASADSDLDTTQSDADPDPTPIQKADLLITQQWLRLIVWQSSFRQGLLSWSAPHESMHFAFPLSIARRTASILDALPARAVEVHGMGIFEKIFEIGTWCINVLGACDGAAATVGSGAGIGLGLDFATGNDLGILGLGRKTPATDPLEFFVRTLSASPMSRERFAERLLLFAGERPGGMRMALSPAISPVLPAGFASAALSPSALFGDQSSGASPSSLGGQFENASTADNIGSVVGEVEREEETDVDMVESTLASDHSMEVGAVTMPGVADDLLSPAIGSDGFSLGDVPDVANGTDLGSIDPLDYPEAFSFGNGGGITGGLNTPRSAGDLAHAASLQHLNAGGSAYPGTTGRETELDSISGTWEM